MLMNDENLVPQAHVLTVEEQSKGGRASGEARRERKRLKEAIETALEAPYTDMLTNDTRSNLEWIVAALIDEARKGSVAAFRELRNTVDGLPIQRIEQETISQETYDRVEKMLEG